MMQMVYKNKFYISGTFPEVIAQLKELRSRFKTVKEFLEHRAKEL